jgi:hypothetical protein
MYRVGLNDATIMECRGMCFRSYLNLKPQIRRIPSASHCINYCKQGGDLLNTDKDG